MKTISDYKNDQLMLVQPSLWKRVYELRTPETVILRMSSPRWFTLTTTVEGFDEKVEIYKQSIWKRHLEIRKAGMQMPFAKLSMKRFGSSGTFELPRGERLKYVSGFLNSRNEIHSEQDQCLVQFKRKISLKPTLDVIITEKSEILDKYPWVIMAVYRIIIERRSQGAH